MWNNLPGKLPKENSVYVEVFLDDLTSDKCRWARASDDEGGAFTDFRLHGSCWAVVGESRFSNTAKFKVIAWRYSGVEEA